MSTNKTGNTNTTKRVGPFNKTIPKFKEVEKELKIREVVGLEVIKGHSMIIEYDAAFGLYDIYYENSFDKDESNSAYVILDGNINNKGYDFHKNIEKFGEVLGNNKVSFAIFGEFIDQETQRQPYITKEDKADFFVYDIYANGNWLCQDDIDYLCGEANIKLAPKVYTGRYNEITLKKALGKRSSYNDKVEVHSILIKPTLEDEVNNKRIATYYINSRFMPKKPDSRELERVANKVIEKYFDKKTMEKVEKSTKAKYKTMNETNKQNVLSFSVAQAVNVYLANKIYWEVDGDLRKSNYDEVHSGVKEVLQKKLPSYFLKQYGYIK